MGKAVSVQNAKSIGEVIKAKRIAEKMTLLEAAAACNVGTRFLLEVERGKPTLHINKVLDVASRFGIRLCITSPTINFDTITNPKISLPIPKFDTGHWLAARQAGAVTSERCGVPVWPIHVEGHEKASVGLTGQMYQLFPNAKPESLGGPGLPAIFSAVEAASDLPMSDFSQLVKWIILSTILGDTSISAERIWIQINELGRHRLAPFPVLVCGLNHVEQSELLGMRVGREWQSEWLRADHWIALAGWAKVKPKLIFQTMKMLASTAPSATEAALKSIYGAAYIRGKPAEILKAVRSRATRMSDLALIAGHHGVAGIKKPVIIKEEVEEKVTFTHETVFE